MYNGPGPESSAMILAGAVVILIVEITLFHFNVKKNVVNHSSTSLRLLLKYSSAYFAVDAKRNFE